MSHSDTVNIGLVGLGYWGPNLLRVFNSLPTARVIAVCDKDKNIISRHKPVYPKIRFSLDFDDIVKDEGISAVVISTPAPTHYELAKKALTLGKDVFVEKPLCLKVSQSRQLLELARKKNKALMVGHLLKYHPAAVRLKHLIQTGRLGRIYYIQARRLNLGKIRRQENVLWSLAVHDIAAMLFLLGEEPASVTAAAGAYINRKIEDLVFLAIYFKSGIIGHIHASWLSPMKVREITVAGSRRMAVFDDIQEESKLKLYNHYVEQQRFVNYKKLPELRFGSVVFEKIIRKEPLLIECERFIECIKSAKGLQEEAKDATAVLKVIKAAEESLARKAAVRIEKE